MQSNGASIKSTETLLRILSYMKEKESVTIKECADELGLASSTVHKHLASVKEARLVVQEGTEYRLGLGFLEYGIAVRNRIPIYDLAKNRIEELAESTGERVWLKVEENGVDIPIGMADGKHAINTDRDIGFPHELHATAGGKAILAHLPKRRREDILETDLKEYTEKTKTDPEALRTELAAIRQAGVAYNRGEAIPGVGAVGAPIINNDGTTLGAIVIAGPEKRLVDERLQGELTELVEGAANEIGINSSYQQ